MKKLVCVYPTYRGQVHVNHLKQLYGILEGCGQSRFVQFAGMVPVVGTIVEHARNIGLHVAIENGADFALMSDADNYAVDGSKLVTMVEDGMEKGVAVIGAAVVSRGHAVGQQHICAAKTPDKWITPAELLIDGKPGIIDVCRIGMGVTAIDCGWIRRNWPDQPWFVSQLLPGPKPSKVGEDVGFCDEVIKRGGRVSLHSLPLIVHDPS